MLSRYLETEVKLYVPDLNRVRARLEALNAPVIAPRILERNVRYDTPDMALRARAAILRLRQDTRIRLTYKDEAESNTQLSALGKTRFEAEVTVDDFDAMQTILIKLGFTPTQVYEKYRTTYTLHDCEIVLDEMPFGSFVEIEGIDTAIEAVMIALDLIDAARYNVSYMVLFERVKHALDLPFNDLTFAHFDGIHVPQSAFDPVP
ncbi:MAG: class IV adenylate cyclase [Phototrophicales bacterium]|nr:MAG: class IV adenylate cyclase [Phototrophicales bacterium]